MRFHRLLILMVAAFVLVVGDARTAVAPDALPDAADPFSVTFTSQSGEAGGVVVTEVAVDGVVAGERVGLTCQGCLGQTSVEAVATGPRVLFRPKLRLTARARLQVRTLARNFGRTSEYRVARGQLRLDNERCTSLADNRAVRCAATRAPRPWATMNVCTAAQVGIRAASPGGGSRRLLVAARFRLQYTDPAGRWADVPNGTSPWITLGRAHRSFQGGYTFEFTGVKGRTFRGLAEFEWRRGSRVERRASRFTSPGRTVTSGSSSSVCVIG